MILAPAEARLLEWFPLGGPGLGVPHPPSSIRNTSKTVNELLDMGHYSTSVGVGERRQEEEGRHAAESAPKRGFLEGCGEEQTD